MYMSDEKKKEIVTGTVNRTRYVCFYNFICVQIFVKFQLAFAILWIHF